MVRETALYADRLRRSVVHKNNVLRRLKQQQEQPRLAPACASHDDDGPLPLLVESSLRLLDAPDVSIPFVHLEDSQGGMFSHKKKQCDLWEFTWGSSIILANILWRWLAGPLPPGTPGSGAGPRFLEIGGGVGLASLVVLRTGAARSVLMTDLVEDALRVFRRSVALQPESPPSRATTVRTRTLNWEKLDTALPDAGEFDVVLGSDVLFGNWVVPHVARAIHQALAPGGFAIVADPCRSHDAAFVDALLGNGLEAHVRDVPQALVESTVPLAEGQKAIVRVHRAKVVVARKRPENAAALGTGALDGAFGALLAALDDLGVCPGRR